MLKINPKKRVRVEDEAPVVRAVRAARAGSAANGSDGGSEGGRPTLGRELFMYVALRTKSRPRVEEVDKNKKKSF